MTTMKMSTKTEIESAIDELLEPAKCIVLYNDDVNTFFHVMMCLIVYCEHEQEQAEQATLIVHNNGKCAVKTGSFDDLKPRCEALLENGLTAKIE